MQFLQDDVLQRTDESGQIVAVQALTAGQVEVELVDRGTLHDGGELGEPRVQAVGIFAVLVVTATDHDQVGAQAECTGG